MLTLCIILVGYSIIIIGTSAEHKNATSIIKDIPLLDKFQQHDYNITFERVELVHFDKQYIKYLKIITYKYNRTSPVMNATGMYYNTDVGNDLEVITQMYKFASNEYRLFPARFQFNFCESVDKNTMGVGDFRKCGTFTGCPLIKEKNYVICNWTPNTAAFPPLIPNGQYMMEFQVMIRSIELFVLHAYATVSRPIPIF